MRMHIACLALIMAVSGCSVMSGGKREHSDKQLEVIEFLDAGRPKAALVVADELVTEAPGDYQSYLTRNTVSLVLHDYAQAQADNAKALEVFEASRDHYPENERNYRLAKIHESFALTALIASRKAQSPDERKQLEELFSQHAQKVKELDEDTWKNLRGLTGEPVGQ